MSPPQADKATDTDLLGGPREPMKRDLIRVMRPGDWVKNVFVLPAVVFSDKLSEPGAIAQAAMAFAAFCLLASGFYAINDVIDAESDRAHPIKRQRPVASGAVSPSVAVTLGVACAIGGLGLGWMVNLPLVAILLSYAVLQVLYNALLKRVVFVDVVAIATGFSLRAAAGAVAIEVQMSIWLLLCVFFLCLYLGFVKRLCDISSAGPGRDVQWRPSAPYDDRNELNWLLGVSAVLAVVTYLMYALSEHAWALFGPRSLGFALLSPLVLIAIHRLYRRATKGTSDNPLTALLEDKAVLASVMLFIIGTLITLYVPAAQQLLESLFYYTDVKAAP